MSKLPMKWQVLEKVLLMDPAISSGEPCTSKAIMEHFGIQKSAAHRYLRVLQQEGLIEATPKRDGESGRPIHVYTISNKGLNANMHLRKLTELASLT